MKTITKRVEKIHQQLQEATDSLSDARYEYEIESVEEDLRVVLDELKLLREAI